MTPPILDPLLDLFDKPTLRINVTPVPDVRVEVPGKKTMPSKSILDPEFKYTTGYVSNVRAQIKRVRGE
jgi:hypothetical protein